MGTINITTEPVEIVVDGTTFKLQGDPSATSEWVGLLEIEVSYTDHKKRATAHQQMIDSLASLAATPEDAETVRGLTVGTATLEKVSKGYMQAVTGFPTKPSQPSKKR